MENIYETLSDLIQSLPEEGFADRVVEEMSKQKEYLPYLFEVLNFVSRKDLGAPMHQTDRDDTVVDDKIREQVKERFKDNCRQIAERFVAFDDLVSAWPYFRAAGAVEPMREALEGWTLPGQLDMQTEPIYDAVFDIAFNQGVHPVRGYELLLKYHGTCDGITVFERQFPHSRESRKECAQRLIRRLYGEILEGIQQHIRREKGEEAPGSTIRELLEGRDWLFDGGAMHVDDSHVQSVIRIAGTIPVCDEHEMVVEMCEYGDRIEGSDPGPASPPFLDFYKDYKMYIEALRGRNADVAIAHFAERAEEAGDANSSFASQLLVFLLEQLDRPQEAVDAYVERLATLPNPTLAPSIINLCERTNNSAKLAESAAQRQDILQLIASRLIG